MSGECGDWNVLGSTFRVRMEMTECDGKESWSEVSTETRPRIESFHLRLLLTRGVDEYRLSSAFV